MQSVKRVISDRIGVSSLQDQALQDETVGSLSVSTDVSMVIRFGHITHSEIRLHDLDLELPSYASLIEVQDDDEVDNEWNQGYVREVEQEDHEADDCKDDVQPPCPPTEGQQPNAKQNIDESYDEMGVRNR